MMKIIECTANSCSWQRYIATALTHVAASFDEYLYYILLNFLNNLRKYFVWTKKFKGISSWHMINLLEQKWKHKQGKQEKLKFEIFLLQICCIIILKQLGNSFFLANILYKSPNEQLLRFVNTRIMSDAPHLPQILWRSEFLKVRVSRSLLFSHSKILKVLYVLPASVKAQEENELIYICSQ